MRLCIAVVIVWGALAAAQAQAVDFRIDNEYGGVSVHIAMDGRFRLDLRNSARQALESDVEIKRTDDVIEIIARPRDRVSFDMVVDVPFGSHVNVRTTSGKISLDGYPTTFIAQTTSGDIALRAPWIATRLRVISGKEPQEVSSWDKRQFRGAKEVQLDQRVWVLEDRLKEDAISYGTVRVRSSETARLTVEDMPIPPEAPIRMHWEARAAFKSLLATSPVPQAAPLEVGNYLPGNGATNPSSELTFSSNVRLVNLQVAVYDKTGTPIAGLRPEDFEVLESGVPQEIQTLESEDTPFNLALLFDLSSSTQRNRNQMKQVASGFLAVARPHDKVAAYVLSNNWFGVVSRLTSDRELLAQRIGALPDLSGGSPLYDAMILSYAEELAQRPNERNALVVISDGVDNRLYGIGQPSDVSFTDVKRAASQMNALLYPVFLGPDERDLTKGSRPYEAYMRFKEMAELAGGRVFSAATLAEFGGVYEEIATELRAEYSLSYSPINQDFQGEFRTVEVRMKRDGATARTRPGYTAK
jgi:Ca-activated chloride channel family protein